MHQNSCHKLFSQGKGIVSPVKIVLSSGVLALKNRVTVSHTMCGHIYMICDVGLTNFWNAGADPSPRMESMVDQWPP